MPVTPNMLNTDDIIFAPASGSGGAVSTVRLSGAGCLELTDKLVQLKRGKVADAPGFSLHFGIVPDLDEVLVSVFRAPKSYTGEDMAELSCHASSFVLGELMQKLTDAGARLAEPGEFTRRAFLNGKMDLAQAEAVADLISSSSSAQHRLALNQLKGGFSSELEDIRASLLELTTLMELELDFSEEEVEFADRSKLRQILDSSIDHCRRLADSFKVGNAVRNGVPVAIIGAPNSGKSTLLNALLKDDRAIVSDIPGTTRDTVEETCVLDGIVFRFIDTAGIRDASDEIEKLGIERTFRKASEARIVLGLVDLSEPESQDAAVSAAKGFAELVEPGQQKLIVLGNKADLANDCNVGPELLGAEYLAISAKTGQGLDELARLLVADSGIASATGTLVTNARHAQALSATAASLSLVREGMNSGVPSDLLSEDLRAALESIGAITGYVTTDEILSNIFNRFCIGK